MIRAGLKSVAVLMSALAVALLQGCSSDDAQASAPAERPLILARGVVDVEGGLVSVRALRAGQLVEIRSALGEQISRGDILAVLEGTSARADLDAARADLQRARAELAGLRRKQHSLDEQMTRVREAVDLGAESGRVRDELQAQIDAQIGEVPVAAASVAAAEARVRAAMFNADSTMIRAPVDGRVVQVNSHLGDVVNVTDSPAIFLVRPSGALIVRASIPARDVAHVRSGSTASITAVDEAAITYEAQVLVVGDLARKPDPSFSTDDFTSERVVDCILQLDHNATLRLGTLVLVSFR